MLFIFVVKTIAKTVAVANTKISHLLILNKTTRKRATTASVFYHILAVRPNIDYGRILGRLS